jgi:hypothetical protein
MSPTWCCIIACLLLPLLSQAQAPGKVEQPVQLPGKFFHSIGKKVSRLEENLTAKTEKHLKRLAKSEGRLKRKLSRVDSAAAKNLFNNSEQQYARLIDKLKSKSFSSEALSGEYFPYADSLRGLFSFIDQKKLALPPGLQDKAKAAMSQFQLLQGRLRGAEQAKEFIRRRRQLIKETLSRYTSLPKNLTKQFAGFNKQLYYYGQQVREYKELLNDPDKITQKALSVINKLPAFQEFMKQHSQLAGLFGLPAGYGNVANLGGLQTRAQVQTLIQGQLAAAGTGGQQILQQNLQAAQAQLNQYKDKLNQLGKGSGDMEMPDFKPNNQRTKSFLQRLEIGTNLQSTKSSYFFPTTTDLGLSIGYKLSDKSTIGIGGSYKVGWGKDIRNIVVTGQGAGMRTFLDIKLKGSFYASGGIEYNYQPADTAGLQLNDAWSSSGLVGITKIVSLKTKFFKKTKLQLLWDFMSYRQSPRTQPVKFRIGYSFR